MTTTDKLLARMRQSQVGWKIEELETVAVQNGLRWRAAKGSHVYFIAADGRRLSIPARRPVKPVYVKRLLELMEVEP